MEVSEKASGLLLNIATRNIVLWMRHEYFVVGQSWVMPLYEDLMRTAGEGTGDTQVSSEKSIFTKSVQINY